MKDKKKIDVKKLKSEKSEEREALKGLKKRLNKKVVEK